MCRLAFIPANSKISRKQMLSFFSQLEGSFGGDGNGYAFVGPDGTVSIRKGVKMSCEQIAKEAHALNRQGNAIYFHTRKISVGWSSNEQCHPFKIQGAAFEGALCHNGTWSEGGTLAKYLLTGSDTATLAYLVGQIGFEELDKRKLMPKSGIFLVFGGKPGDAKIHSVLNLGGSLEYCPATGVWASEFFKDWPGYANTYRVEEGAHMLDKPAPKAKFVASKYVGYSGGTGGHYSTYVKPTSSTHTSERARMDQYWKDKGYADEIELADDYKLANSDEELWGDRIFYHN